MGAEFAAKYPKIAARLLLEADASEDPHVERLIQAFAFLAARVHHKIDDDFPEVTEALLNVLYPHYLAPIPSMSVVQFVLDPEQGKLTSGYAVAKGSTLYSHPVDGAPCRFRCLLSRYVVAGSDRDSESRTGRLTLRCFSESGTRINTARDPLLEQHQFARLNHDRLVFLHGESALTYALYELLFNNVIEVRIPSSKPNESSRIFRCRPAA